MTARCAVVDATGSYSYPDVDPIKVLSIQDGGLQAHQMSLC